MTLVLDWIIVGDGWAYLILSVNVLFLTGIAIFAYEINLRVMRVEIQYHGLKDRINGVQVSIDVTNKNVRRVTDSFDEVINQELEQAATRIRDRVKPNILDDDQE